MKIEFAAIKIVAPPLSEENYRIVSLPAHSTYKEIIRHFNLSKVQILKKGFVTSTGKFVGRKKAWKIARDANQIRPAPTENPGKLYTSDIDWSI